MTLKNKLRGLYAITPDGMDEELLCDTTEKVLQGGAKIVQFRDKSSNRRQYLHRALKLRDLCKYYQSLFIINDDVCLAAECGADGIHLGKNDSTIADARSTLGNEAIIGTSCYGDILNAYNAIEAGADYIAFGSVFKSTTKPTASNCSIDIIP